MILPLRNKEMGFSIIEVVIAALIFAIAVAGIMSTLSSFVPKANISEREVRAALYARQLIEQLRMQVDAQTWNTGNLVPGTYNYTYNIFNATVVIGPDPVGNGVRVANLTITWFE